MQGVAAHRTLRVCSCLGVSGSLNWHIRASTVDMPGAFVTWPLCLHPTFDTWPRLCAGPRLCRVPQVGCPQASGVSLLHVFAAGSVMGLLVATRVVFRRGCVLCLQHRCSQKLACSTKEHNPTTCPILCWLCCPLLRLYPCSCNAALLCVLLLYIEPMSTVLRSAKGRYLLCSTLNYADLCSADMFALAHQLLTHQQRVILP